jgi:preprotein translocase subunit SecG
MPTLPFTPKLRCFGPFLIFFLSFLLKKKKKKKRKKKRGNRGGWSHPLGQKGGGPAAVWGGRSHSLAKKGVVRPPYFWARGWLEPISLFLLLLLLLGFFLKKKKKTKIRNGPKRRSFGVKGIMDRFLQNGPK